MIMSLREIRMANFYIYVDREGKMPQLRRKVWDCRSHTYYVRYQNDRPVARRGPLEVIATNGRIWDYSLGKYVSVELPEE